MAVGTHICWPKKVVCGSGALQNLGQIIKEMNKSNVIIITDKVMKDYPIITDTVKNLRTEGLIVTFWEIGPNPLSKWYMMLLFYERSKAGRYCQ